MLFPRGRDTFENKVQHTVREYEGRISSCLGENGSAMYCGSLGGGLPPPKRVVSREKTKVKGFIRHDSKCADSDSKDTFENAVQHTTREDEGRIPSCLGENRSAVADP